MTWILVAVVLKQMVICLLPKRVTHWEGGDLICSAQASLRRRSSIALKVVLLIITSNARGTLRHFWWFVDGKVAKQSRAAVCSLLTHVLASGGSKNVVLCRL